MMQFCVFFAISFLCISLSFEKLFHISCGSCSDVSLNSSPLGNCFTHDVDREQYSSSSKDPAPLPHLENLTYYTYTKVNQSRIALNLSWSQTGKEFRKTDEYFLSIKRESADKPDFRKFSFNLSSHIYAHLAYSDKVIVNYLCYGREFEYVSVDQGYSYFITLRSLPSYHENTAVKAIKSQIKIEYDEYLDEYYSYDDYYSNYVYLDNDVDIQTYSSQPTKSAIIDNDTKESSLVLIAQISGVFLICLALLVFVAALTIKKYYHDETTLLLLISTHDKEGDEDHKYLQAADKLSDILKQQGNIKVISNVWNDINMKCPLKWFDESVKLCKHIILICTPLGKKNWINNNTNDLFVMGFEMLRKEKIKKRWFSSNSYEFSVIYFDDDPGVCIPDEMVTDNIKYRNVLKDLKSIYKKVTFKILDTNLENVASFKVSIQLINSSTHTINSETILLDKSYKFSCSHNQDHQNFV